MSVRLTAAQWVVDRLASEINYLKDVGLIASPEDFDKMSYDVPSVAVIIIGGANSLQPTPPSEDLYLFNLQVWMATNNFIHDEFASSETGIYTLLDDIHSALAYKRPTGCSLPLIIQRDSLQVLRDGLIEWAVEYQTGLVIGD